jgi:hypothetical protein
MVIADSLEACPPPISQWQTVPFVPPAIETVKLDIKEDKK